MIIGLTGYKGSGKSVVARHLSAHHGFSRKPFAYPLKAMVGALGVPPHILDGSDADKSMPLDVLNGRTARHALQTLGTEWGRQYMGDDFWIVRWADGLRGLVNVVADDVRFPNEARALRERGGVIIRVTRDGVVSSDGHASENPDAIPYDYSIANIGSEDDLRAAVDVWLERWKAEVYAV